MAIYALIMLIWFTVGTTINMISKRDSALATLVGYLSFLPVFLKAMEIL